MMRKVFPVTLLVCLPLFVFSQLSITAVKTTFTVDFNTTVSGVNNNTFTAPMGGVATAIPSPGALDRDAFQISSSAGTSFNWPASPVDITEGKGASVGGAVSPGIYGYISDATNYLLGVNPDDSNFTPGAIILRVQNNSGDPITQFDVDYTAYAYDGGTGKSTLNVYYSSDGMTWLAASDLDYESSNGSTDDWESSSRSACIPGLNIADGGYFYLKWVINEGGGSNVDEIGIDDIQLFGRTPVVGFTTSSSVVAELDDDPEGNTQNYFLSFTMEAPPRYGTARVSITASDSTAEAPSDFAAVTTPQVLFPPNECYPQTKEVMLLLKKDTDPEPNEILKATLNLITAGYAETAITTHYITLANDDPDGVVTLYSQLENGHWNDSGMWKTGMFGGSEYTDPNNLLGNSGPQYNLIVQVGDTVILDDDKGIHNLTINNTGKLYANSDVNVRFLQIYGDEVDVDGMIGNGSTKDGISLEIQSDSCDIKGFGSIDLFQIRRGGDEDTTKLFIKTDVNLRGTGTVFYNNSDGVFNPTITASNTLALQFGDVSIDGQDGTSPNNSKGTFTVNGILDIEDGNLFLKTNNPTAGTDDITYHIGSTGMLKVRNSIFGNEGNSGAAEGIISILSGGELQLSGVNDFFVDYSSARNDEDFEAGSKVNFAGNFAQMLPPFPFYRDLTLSGGGDKTLQTNITVLGTLTLQDGNLALEDHDLTIFPSGSISGGSSSSYVETNGTGALIQNIGSFGDKDFPVGNSSYNPANLTNFGAQGDNYSVRVVDQVLLNGLSGSVVTEDVVNRTWLIDEEIAGGSSLTIGLQWSVGDQLSGFNPNNCYVGHYVNGVWEQGNIDMATFDMMTSSYFLSTSGIDEFSPFVVAKAGVILPIELAYFHAFAKGERAVLEWSTITELNNDYFVIERSGDLRNFEPIGTVAGQGTSQETNDYSFVDKTPLTGVNYYRLKQVDFDGAFSYSDIETVRFTGGDLQIWPNPTKSSLHILVENAEEHPAIVEIFNIAGQRVYTSQFQQLPNQLDVTPLPKGSYLLQIRAGDIIRRERFIKQ